MIVKLTHPSSWPPDLKTQTPRSAGVVGDCRFEINNACTDCDYWIVWGGLETPQTVNCPKENLIYVTDETHAERRFVQRFLDQFAAVIACREDIRHREFIKTHELGAWHMKKSYDEVMAAAPPAKTQVMSVIASTTVWLEGHRRRYEFVQQLIARFKDRIHVYGRGLSPIADKSQGLDAYKYSIAIENSTIAGYFTEKINDCYVSYTMPVYHGCPNIAEYYPARSFVSIDVRDPKRSLDTIEEVLESDLYERNFDAVVDARRRFIEKYHCLPAMVEMLRCRRRPASARTRHTVVPESWLSDVWWKNTVKALRRGALP
jgi:hypothetical protein